MQQNRKLNKYTQPPAALPPEQLRNRKAIIHTDKGSITIELFGESAPITVSNFIFLAKEEFYNGITFHRREPGFVIQGGDPSGMGGGGPGYNIPPEIKESHIRGAVAMARLPNEVNPTRASSGSQFYITLEEIPFLDGEYTVFGKVIQGIEITDVIEVGTHILRIDII